MPSRFKLSKQSYARFLITLLMGFSSGLPLLLTRSTLKAWLTEGGIDIKAVGFFSLVALPYGFKFAWSPIVDWLRPFKMGRRRGWLLIAQCGIAGGLAALAACTPGVNSIWLIACAAVWTAFWSATQDVVVDAYRRESFADEDLGLASSIYVTAYRVALLVAGGGALYMASVFSWRESYLAMAAAMAMAMAVTWFAPEPSLASAAPPRTLRESTIGPLREFFARDGAWTILAFVVLYKLGEQMASDMLNPFFLKIGFSKPEIAAVAKFYGFWAAIAGGLAGGWAIRRMNVLAALLAFGILQSAALALFSWLAAVGPNTIYLAVAVGAENFSSGMATAGYMTFMATQTDRRFTATQYALLSSVTGVIGPIAGAATGVMAERLGWSGFFVACIFATAPGLALLWPLRRLSRRSEAIA